MKRGKGGHVARKEDEEDRVYRKEEKEEHSQTRLQTNRVGQRYDHSAVVDCCHRVRRHSLLLISV